MLPSSVAEAARAQQRTILATIGSTRAEWAKMGNEFDASWATIGPRIALLTASAQLGAARNGAASIPAILAELGQSVDPWGEVNPSAFVGFASDGRPLDSLLDIAVIRAKQATRTMPVQAALAAGGKWLDMAVHTQVADASRGAAGVAIAARPKVGWIRQPSGSSCGRCAPLLGKWFRFNEGFDRHKNDDCFHLPSTEASSPDLLKPADPDKITDLTKSERKAIAEGADVNQVLNARNGRSGMTTTEGTTKRGVYGGYKRNPDGSLTKRAKAEKVPSRLTPAGIYRLASDRTEAVKLLKQFGYVL